MREADPPAIRDAAPGANSLDENGPGGGETPSHGLRRIAFLGNYLPRRCGLATFTTDLCEAFAARFPGTECFALAMHDHPEGYAYPPAVRLGILSAEPGAYLRAAEFLERQEVDVLCVQHEFGIYGGAAGSHLLALLDGVRVPASHAWGRFTEISSGAPGILPRAVFAIFSTWTAAGWRRWAARTATAARCGRWASPIPAAGCSPRRCPRFESSPAFTSPRAWASALLGLHAFSRRFPGDRRPAADLRGELSDRLLGLLRGTAGPGWPWFENILSYENALLPCALLLSGRAEALEPGLRTLRWLLEIQTTPAGSHFSPVGSHGFYPRGGPRARFDQQPIEAGATVEACLEAHRGTGDPFWSAQARRVFEWFLGRNDLGLPLYDPTTGGCRDGLHADRANENQGAESTLAFHLALAGLRGASAAEARSAEISGCVARGRVRVTGFSRAAQGHRGCGARIHLAGNRCGRDFRTFSGTSLAVLRNSQMQLAPTRATKSMAQDYPNNPSTTRTTTATTSLEGAHVAVPAPSAAHKRISWGAIFAGVVMALVSQLAFSLLGLGLGASAFNPYDDNPAGGLGIGAAIWTLLTTLISLYTGGYVAGRLAGFPREQDSMLHGLVTFGLTSLIGFYLLTSGIGKIIGGAGSLVSSVVSSAGKGIANAAPGLVDAAKEKLQDSGIDLSDIQGQVDQLLRQTGKAELQPENLQNRAQNAADQAQGTAQNAAQNPNAAGGDLKSLVSRVFGQNKDVVNAADKDALVNVIMSRAGKSREEANQIVANYQKTYEQTKAKAQQVAAEAKEKAKAAADAARKGAARAGLASSLALLLGAFAAAFGGRSATPRDLVGVTTTGTTTTRP